MENQNILRKLNEFKLVDSDLGRVDHLEELEDEKNFFIDYYLEWQPHEISLLELEEINPRLFRELSAIKDYFNL